MGVYAIRNVISGKVFIDVNVNVSGRLNRARFELENRSHASQALQNDWDKEGSEAFTFEVIDTLDRPKDPGVDPSDDLEELLQIWMDKLELTEEMLYPHR